MIGEESHVIQVPGLATAAPVTRQRLPPTERCSELPPLKFTLTKMYPPALPTDRQNMQVSEIKAILDTHSIPYNEGFTKSQLLYILDQTSPILGTPGRPLYHDALSDKFSWSDPSGSLPSGWECRLSRAGERYYYDRVSRSSSWNDPRNTKLNESGEPRSDPVLLPQRISGPEIPPSRQRPLEARKPHPTKVSESWTAEHTAFRDEKTDGR